MKKIFFLSAFLLGLVPASHAGIRFNFGFGLPLPVPPFVVQSPRYYPPPVYQAPPPAYCPPPTYYAPPVVVGPPVFDFSFGPGYYHHYRYGNGYRGYGYGYRGHGHGYRHDRRW